MAELADARDLKSREIISRTGSIPASGTTSNFISRGRAVWSARRAHNPEVGRFKSPPRNQTQKAPLVGAFLRLVLMVRSERYRLPGYADERSLVGECGCALPVADEAQSHECAACPRLRRARQVCLWQTLRVAEGNRAPTRADRCGHRNRASKCEAFVRETRRSCGGNSIPI